MPEHQRYNYIRRSGRMTKSQSQGYDETRKRYLQDINDWCSQAPQIGVEIGFGMGQGLYHWATQAPDWRLVGIELYRPGVGALAQQLEKSAIENVALIEEPAQIVCAELRAQSVDEIRILFPDPWPKKRHAKRRLIQPEFIEAISRVLKDGAALKIATDWDPYAEWIREVMTQQPLFTSTLDHVSAPISDDGSTEQTVQHPQREEYTKFERRGLNLGHRIHDLNYVCGKNSATTVSR